MTLLTFDYVNWKGEDHNYVIEECRYTPSYPSPVHEGHWVIHGDVVTRDGDTRPTMGPTRRRTFEILKMRNIKEIP